MEVAPGGSGGQQVSGPENGSKRVRLNLLLYVVVLVVAAAAVVVGVSVVDRLRDDPAPSSLPGEQDVQAVALDESDDEEQERLAAVVEAATAESNALLNITHEDPQASFDAVLAGATGEFRDQFEKAVSAVSKSLKENRSVQESDVVWTGVVAADADSATVAVAASGTVTNKLLEGKQDARNYRLQLELVLEDGAWLTRDLQFVG
ncbi:Mce-associated membrane protein [Nocardioides lianchengensis]|uniref:Mce-associated membrane protein n=1 Tax=Nocardioides lianchengensis TaxID=1045774 RepID=A0A1G6RFH9_9ACTN|nr:Mce-associated membrane protein [Nocardioides lianchengensis]